MLWTLLSVASRTAAARAQLRVVTMNIHAWRDSDHRLNFDRLVDQLQRLRPDIVCLNEVLHPFCAPAADDPYWEEVRARRGYDLDAPAPGSVPDDVAESLLHRLADAVALPHLVRGYLPCISLYPLHEYISSPSRSPSSSLGGRGGAAAPGQA